MAGLTDLIQNMIKENEETQVKLDETLQGFENLKNIVETQTSDEHLIELMQEEFYKSPYFESEDFFYDVGQTLIDKYGLGNLINLDKLQVNQAIIEYLQVNLDVEAIVNALMKYHTTEIREAMIRRIRIESKSILDNYDFSLQVIPRLKVLFDEYMKNHRLNQYLLRATTQLFVAQETNLAFMLEYIVTRELLQK